jgi:hypothetical protein
MGSGGLAPAIKHIRPVRQVVPQVITICGDIGTPVKAGGMITRSQHDTPYPCIDRCLEQVPGSLDVDLRHLIERRLAANGSQVEHCINVSAGVSNGAGVGDIHVQRLLAGHGWTDIADISQPQ